MEDKRSSWVTEEQKKKVEEVIEKEEGVTRLPNAFWAKTITILAVTTSLFAIYAAVGTVTTQILRGVHVALVLTVIFLHFPAMRSQRKTVSLFDIGLVLLSVATIAYMFLDPRIRY